jgi:hypothetical protein
MLEYQKLRDGLISSYGEEVEITSGEALIFKE